MAVGEVTVAGLLGAPFIMREQRSGTRAAREEFFQWQPVELSVAREADSHEIIKQAVMAGMAVMAVMAGMAGMGLSFLSLHTPGPGTGQRAAQDYSCRGCAGGAAVELRAHLAKMLSPAAESFRYFVLERGEGRVSTSQQNIIHR